LKPESKEAHVIITVFLTCCRQLGTLSFFSAMMLLVRQQLCQCGLISGRASSLYLQIKMERLNKTQVCVLIMMCICRTRKQKCRHGLIYLPNWIHCLTQMPSAAVKTTSLMHRVPHVDVEICIRPSSLYLYVHCVSVSQKKGTPMLSIVTLKRINGFQRFLAQIFLTQLAIKW